MKLAVAEKNAQGGYFQRGKSFDETKWASIVDAYRHEIDTTGKCTINRLMELTKIGRKSAMKAINYHNLDSIPFLKKNARKGVGSYKRLKMKHHAFIFSLYLSNPSLPNYGYCEEMKEKYGISISTSFISRWFKTIGPFKGNYRKTSRFPPAKYSKKNTRLLKRYLAFASQFDPSRFVFADEKPMKEIHIFGSVRRNIMDGTIPNHKCRANSKNRWNILAACTIKRSIENPVEYLIIDECTDASIFANFVARLIEKGVLQRGDIFVVDNCTIHMKGDNSHLQDQLLQDLGVLMVPLPPYWCELNPTELVFNSLLMNMRSERKRYNAGTNDQFFDDIDAEMNDFTRDEVKSFFKKCGYV